MSAWIQKIDVRKIVTGHLATLVYDESQERSNPDLLLFYGVPCAVALGLFVANINLSNGAVNAMTTALAVLAGLLFNLLVMLQTLEKPTKSDPFYDRLVRLVSQVYFNIAYCILIALVCLIPLVLASNYDDATRFDRRVAAAVVEFLGLHFVLTLCMVLKRMHVLLTKQFG